MNTMITETKEMIDYLPENYLKQVYNFVKRAPKVEKLSIEEEIELREIEEKMDKGEKYSFEEVFG